MGEHSVGFVLVDRRADAGITRQCVDIGWYFSIPPYSILWHRAYCLLHFTHGCKYLP
jgi:hypothetical protein